VYRIRLDYKYLVRLYFGAALLFIAGHSPGHAYCVGQDLPTDVVSSYDSVVDSEIRTRPDLYVNGDSKLYEIRKANRFVGTVYGTMHSRIAQSTLLSPEVIQRFDAAQSVILETDFIGIDAERLGKIVKSSQHDATPLGVEFVQTLDSMTEGSLRRFSGETRMSLNQIADLSVERLAAILTTPQCAQDWQRIQRSALAMDIQFSVWARLARKPVLALEPAYQIPSLPLYSAYYVQNMRELLTLYAKRSNYINSIVEYKSESYFMGMISRSVAFDLSFEANDHDRLLSQIDFDVKISGRNDRFVEQIAKELDYGRTQFVAIGAAHLIGRRGIIQQLKDRGYEVGSVLETRPNRESR